MGFLEKIFDSLEQGRERVVLREIRSGEFVSVTGAEVLDMVARARAFLSGRGLKRGDRCGILGHNSVGWVAIDLAIMSEGLIVVPLYARQAAGELVTMMKDCSPALICCGDAALRDAIAESWREAPAQVLFEEILSARGQAERGVSVPDSEAVTIIYTSGTSGEAKGVVLTTGNVGHMLECTSGRLDVLNAVASDGIKERKALTTKDTKVHEGKTSLLNNKAAASGEGGQDCVFHYLPFCFAGSWIMLLACLLRGSLLTLNTDLSTLAADMRRAEPDYFLNVPALLERMRKAVDEQLWKTGGIIQFVYGRAKAAWARNQASNARKSGKFVDGLYLWLANLIVFPTIRKKMIGKNLKALICGSAPLSVETQLYFMMLGIPVLQVYGLTETTAICTMDDPRRVEPGWVGPTIEGVEMRLGEHDEIMVRGPNIFRGYWNRAEETTKVLWDGWFHTGDEGEVNARGNWRIVGRIKNLIILGSGHNVAPEPIEEKILQELPEAQQVVLVGNGRGYLAAIVTGAVVSEQVQRALDAANVDLPHYKQVRGFYLREEAFSTENGMLTANGKLKRDVIYARLRSEIEDLYAAKQAS